MIDRKKTIKGLECCQQMSGDACQKCPYISDCDNLSAGVPHLAHDALELLKEKPEIVRCKECIYHHYTNDRIPYCELIDYGYGWKDNDFCSRGKRR